MAEWELQDLGSGTYVFRWNIGHYFSPFVVTRDGVVAVDPINQRAAGDYRAAIASVTSAPVTTIIYSHEHKDHISGAATLAPEATVIAHRHAARRLERRQDPAIAPPSTVIDEGADLGFGDHRITLRYFGPNHSNSNMAIVMPIADGSLLYYADLVEESFAPYRNLPDTDIDGLLDSLRAARALKPTRVFGGHFPPGDPVWIDLNLRYFDDLLRFAAEEHRASRPSRLPDEDLVSMAERIRRETSARVAARLEPDYQRWRGFYHWAPMHADRILTYLVTGN